MVKLEFRSTKFEISTNVQNPNVLKIKKFRILIFEFVSDFDIRISDLEGSKIWNLFSNVPNV